MELKIRIKKIKCIEVTIEFPIDKGLYAITGLDLDLSQLANLSLIETLIDINTENEKGTPVFIEP